MNKTQMTDGQFFKELKIESSRFSCSDLMRELFKLKKEITRNLKLEQDVSIVTFDSQNVSLAVLQQ